MRKQRLAHHLPKRESDVKEDVSTQTTLAVGRALENGFRVVATLDGALIDDIEQALSDLGIWGRPLLGQSVPRAQRDAGPWMVSPDRVPTEAFAELIKEDDPDATTAAFADAAAKATEAGDDASPLFNPDQPSAINASNEKRAWSLLCLSVTRT